MEVQQVDLSQVKGIDSVSVDLKKYDKLSCDLDTGIVTQVPSKFSEFGKQWVLKISSLPVEVIGEGDDLIEFRASELFNLIQDDDPASPSFGKLLGFPKGEKSNLYQFLTDVGVNVRDMQTLQQICDGLQGKKAVIKAYDKEVDGSKKTYLKFRY